LSVKGPAVVAAFLEDALTGGAVPVAELDRKAHAEGLLGEGQTVTDLKLFKAVKNRRGIRSIRRGFGPGAIWLWVLPTQPNRPAVETAANLSSAISAGRLR
jgi:hypothetical protein